MSSHFIKYMLVRKWAGKLTRGADSIMFPVMIAILIYLKTRSGHVRKPMEEDGEMVENIR